MAGRTAERAARRARRRFRRLYRVAVVLIVAFGVILVRNRGDDPVWTAVDTAGQLLAAVLAAAAGAVTARRSSGRARCGWSTIAAGCAAWAVGRGIWLVSAMVLHHNVPAPGIADIGFVAAPVLWTAGILMLVDTPPGTRSRTSGLLEGLMIAGGVFLPTWALALAPVVRESGGPGPAQIVDLARPVLDLVVLASLLFAFPRCRRHARGSLALVAIGVAAIATADSGFWYLRTVDSYIGTNLFDLGWFAGFLFIGLGSSRPSAGTPTGTSAGTQAGAPALDPEFRDSWRLLSVPDVIYAVGMCVTVLVAFRSRTTVLGPFERYAFGGLLVVGLVHRMSVLVENLSLTVGLEARVRARTSDLEKRERYFAALVRSSSDIVIVVDEARTIRSVSASLDDIYGWDHHRLVGRPFDSFGPFEALIAAVDAAAANSGRVHRVEWQLVDASGVTRSAESTVSNLLGDADIGCFVINTRDVTDRATLETQLRHQAFHDPLTGLPNRALFADRVGHALRRSGVSGARVGLAMVDLDGFKAINDSHGHHAGDRVLRSVADQLTSALEPGETVARLGGDEFAILVEDIDDTVDPASIAERLLECIHVVVDVEGMQYEVRASVGLAISTRSTSHPADAVQRLLRDADIAMYSAKRAGRGAARVFRPEMYADAQDTFELQSQLRGAVERGEMVLFYQPTFELATGRISGFEALIRWQHPAKGLIGPSKFIPLAEESGVIVSLGDWALRTAVGQLAAWSREFGDGGSLSMAINVSVGQLRSPGLLDSLREVIGDAGIDPRRIVLEITESMLISDTDTVVGLLHDMADLGVRIAIDDFGTGYASLANLQNLPLDVLKIDRTFVSGEFERDGAPLLSTILNIGSTLGLMTVGEGIENQDQLAMLRNGGCDIGQGYYLARPLPAAAVREMLVVSRAADRRDRNIVLPVLPVASA